LKTNLEGTEFPINKNTVHEFSLYFIAGYCDTVNIYLNKKLIRSLYVVPMAFLDHSYGVSPIKFSISFKSNNFLELKRKNSNLVHYTYLQKGYVAALLYLDNRPTEVIYTNNLPFLQ